MRILSDTINILLFTIIIVPLIMMLIIIHFVGITIYNMVVFALNFIISSSYDFLAKIFVRTPSVLTTDPGLESGDLNEPSTPETGIDSQFKKLQITTPEFVSTLSPAELTTLQSNSDAKIKTALTKHAALARLETDLCSILSDRPEKTDTILLVKQYRLNGLWRIVPQASHIYSMRALNTWFTERLAKSLAPTNPSTNEPLLDPSNYNSFPTRHVWHKYYDNAGNGVSQERDQLTKTLRAYCLKADSVDVLEHQSGLRL